MTSNYRRVALGVVVVCFIAAINLSQEKLTLGPVVPSEEEIAKNVHYAGQQQQQQQTVVKSESEDGPDDSASEDQANEVETDDVVEEPAGDDDDAGQESAGEDDADDTDAGEDGDDGYVSEDNADTTDNADDDNASEAADAADDENASEDDANAGDVENTNEDENATDAGDVENASEVTDATDVGEVENAVEDESATEVEKNVNEEEDNGKIDEEAGEETTISEETVGNGESNDNEEIVDGTENELNENTGDSVEDNSESSGVNTDETNEGSGDNVDETNEDHGNKEEVSGGSDDADEGGKSKNQLRDQCDDEESSNRWSDREWPASTVQSLVNCDLSDTKCTYFYPANFFDAKCGLGKKFSKYVEQIEKKRMNGTLWNNMPSVGFPTITMDRVCFDETGRRVELEDGTKSTKETDELHNIGLQKNDDGSRCMTERLSFLHVHKSGGSSLHAAFNAFNRSPSAQVHRHKFYTPSSLPIPPSEAESHHRQKAGKSVEHATKYPTGQFNSEQHVIFALMRDPTERFISSMGQAMGANGSTANRVGPKISQACIDAESTPASTLKCVAKYVKDHTFWVELHFTPQVLDISFATLYKDVPIAIFPFTEIKTVLDYFGKGNIQFRNGKSERYRTDKVLTDMTVDDYDDESLQIVCELYEMDVLMARSVGIEIPRCDPHIPHKYEFER